MKLRNLFNTARTRIAQIGTAVSLIGLSNLALADAIDTTTVTAQITAASAAVLLVGAAVVAGPKVGVRLYKWISGAL